MFNFEMEGNSTMFEAENATANIRIERLDASTIPSILGESGFQAFLHPAGIGDCFVVEEEGASALDDFKWLVEKRQKSLELCAGAPILPRRRSPHRIFSSFFSAELG